MDEDDQTTSKFATSQELMDQIRYVAEALSIGFDRWEAEYVRGPSLYVLIVAGAGFEEYTDPLGGNTWPVDRCRVIFGSEEAFKRVAGDVARTRDGAVIVTADGTIQEQMVRVRSPSRSGQPETGDMDYPDWMGTKHVSALETSRRENVLWAITLSEEDGRVTTFRNGTYQDYPRAAVGGRWRADN